MPQTLHVEINEMGVGKVYKKINVIRSWQDGAGALIMLFSNGSYGYKNGEPVRREEEFNIIAAPLQRKAAVAWWKSSGASISEAYYKAKEQREAELMGDFRHVEKDDSDLDMALYVRSNPNSLEETEPEGPFSWMTLFTSRPDWWGQALSIRFGDYTYTKADSAAAGPPATTSELEEEMKRADASAPSKTTQMRRKA